MSLEDGTAKKTLTNESSYSSTGSNNVGGVISNGEFREKRRREYGKKDRKTVRILTVLVYIVCVSTTAVLLSAYYIFLWNPSPTTNLKSSQHKPASNTKYHFGSSQSINHQNKGHHSRRTHTHLISYGNTKPYYLPQILEPMPLLMTTSTVPNTVQKSPSITNIQSDDQTEKH